MDCLELFKQQLFNKYIEMALNNGKTQEEINKNIEKATYNLNHINDIILEKLNKEDNKNV